MKKGGPISSDTILHGHDDKEKIIKGVVIPKEVTEALMGLSKVGDIMKAMAKPTNHLKTISKTKDELRVANYMVLFGGEDLVGETFTKDTKFESSYTKTGALYVDWEHGFDPEGDGPKRDDVLGIVDWKTAKKDETGLWVERVLNRRAEYMEFIETLIDEELLGTSSQATGKTKVNEDGVIEVWPLKRDALTVMPAEKRMMKEYGDNTIQAIKSLVDKMPNLKSLLPSDGAAVSEGEDEVEIEVKQVKVKIKEKTMTEDIKDEVLEENPLDGVVAAQGQELAEQGESINELTKMTKEILDRMQSEPANRDAGFYSDVGGEADEKAKSFGDFLLAVQRGDKRRLNKVYESSTKAMGEADGTAGGYLVPEEFHNQLLAAAALTTIVRPRATVISVGTDAGKIPALDQYTVPTPGVGQTAFAGGIVGGWAAEGTAGSSTDAAFKQIEYNIKKIAAFTRVSNELTADSAMSIESLLSQLFGTAVGAIEEMSFLRGSGAGSPLGMLEANCAIGIDPATGGLFGLEDAVEMISRFKGVGGQPIWIGHISLLPDMLRYFPAGTTGVHGLTAGVGAFIQPREAIPGSLLGYPMFWSEHMPSADSEAIMLVDPKAYVIFDREPVRIAFSEHARFENDQGTFRVTKRLDGQPWMQGAITLAGPTALTVSPIVYHKD